MEGQVVVIGGGIAGLACARGIADRLSEHQVVVLEAASRAGGAIQTQTRDGFVAESGRKVF